MTPSASAMSALIASPQNSYHTINSIIKWKRWLILLASFFLLASNAFILAHSKANFPPQNITWTGSINTDWATAGNWNTTTVPSANDNVIIPNTSNAPIIDGLTAAVAKSVIVELNAHLTIAASGSLTIDDADFEGLVSEGTILNSGTLVIGSNVGPFSKGISNRGTFINQGACSEFRIASGFENFVSFTNNGLLSLDTDLEHNNFGTFTNDGIVEYRQLNTIPNIINNDLIITPVEFLAPNCGFPQIDVLDFGSANSFMVSTTWYQDEAQTIPAGTYDQGSNTFTPTAAPAPPSTLYFTVTNGACTHEVAINYTAQAVDNSIATWTGLVSSDWEEACNWSTGLVPEDNTRVIIAPSVNSCQIAAAQMVAANSIAIEVGASLSIDADGDLAVLGDTIAIDNFGTLTNEGEISVTKLTDSYGGLINHGTLINTGIIEVIEGSVGLSIEPGSIFENSGGISALGGNAGVQLLEDGQNDGEIVAARNNIGIIIIADNFVNSTTGKLQATVATITGIGIYFGTLYNHGRLVGGADELGIHLDGGNLVSSASGHIEIAGGIAAVRVDADLQNSGNIEVTSNTRDGIWVVNGTVTNDGNIHIEDANTAAISVTADGSLINRSTILIGDSDFADDAIEGNGIMNRGTFDNQGTINMDGIDENGIDHASGSFLNTGNINIGMSLAQRISGYGFQATEGFTNEGTLNIDHSVNDAMRLSSAISVNSGTINIGHNSSTGTTGILLDQNAELQNLLAGDINIKNYSTGIKTDAAGGTFTSSGSIAFENTSTYAVESQGDFVSDGLISGEGEFLLSDSEMGGVLSPGFSPGTLSFTNNLDFLESSVLIIEVQGSASGSFDQIVGSGDIDISNATLSASITYSPSDGDRIVIIDANTITSTFQSVSPALPAGWFFDYTVAGEVAIIFNAALPVDLVYFEATKAAGEVVLDWQTASESNNQGFDILHSTNGLDWRNIGFVTGNGNAQESNSYAFTHSEPVIGDNYYRLRQLDFDGQFSDSAIRTVKFNGPTAGFELQVYPNPTVDYTQIHLPALHAQGQLAVTNTIGHIIFSARILAEQEQIQLDVQDWPAGTYLIHLRLGQSTSTLKLIRTKT